MPTPASMTSDDLRTFLAEERTFLAWMRTAMAMSGLGFLIARFGLFLRDFAITQGHDVQQSPQFSIWIGTGMILLAAATHLVTARQHLRFVERFASVQADEMSRSRFGVRMSYVLALLGVLMAGYLLMLKLSE